MPEYIYEEFFSNQGTRNEVRMRVVNRFAMEPLGEGKGELASKHTYNVENLTNGEKVYLRRPANLHNGFDFIVCVSGYNFALPGNRKRNYPKHEDITADLGTKKNESPTQYQQLFALLERVHSCQDVQDEEYANLHFTFGFPVDMVLKTIKWLFIEQDIRYWNYSGRNMLWDGIPKP